MLTRTCTVDAFARALYRSTGGTDNLTDGDGGGLNGQPNVPYINRTLMAAGVVGGHLPIVIYYFPVQKNSSYLPSNANPYVVSSRTHLTCLATPTCVFT